MHCILYHIVILAVLGNGCSSLSGQLHLPVTYARACAHNHIGDRDRISLCSPWIDEEDTAVVIVVGYISLYRRSVSSVISMAEVKDNLIAQKGIIKGQITRFLKYLEDGGQEVAQIQARLDKLEQHLAKFEDIQGQLEALEPDNTTHITEREYVENTYYYLVAQSRQIIHKSQADMPDTKPMPTPWQQRAKLSKIQLPSFKGDTQEWLSFRNIFVSLIHSNVHLSKLDKLHYLRGALKEQAAQVIHELELSDKNYDTAWELLNKRYHDLKVITRTHLQLMLEYPKLLKESHKGLRTLLDEYLKHTSALQTLNHPVDSWDVIMVYVLTSKLDHVTYRAWEIHSSSDPSPTFKGLCDFIQSRCNMLATMLHEAQSTSKHTLSRSARPTNSARNTRSSTTLVINQRDSDRECGICKEYTIHSVVISCSPQITNRDGI